MGKNKVKVIETDYAISESTSKGHFSFKQDFLSFKRQVS